MSNKKHKWTEKEEKNLLKYINANKQLEYISKKLKISDKLIIHKLKKFATKLLGKKTKEEILSLLKLLTDEQLDKIIQRQNKKKQKNISNDKSIDLSDFASPKKQKNIEVNTNKKEINKVISETLLKDNNIISNDDISKIYKMLIDINSKLDAVYKKVENLEISSKHNDDLISSSKSSIKLIKNNVNNDDFNNEEISTSSEDTDDATENIINLIKNRTDGINEARQKYMDEVKKSYQNT
jgi:hypothetical protein